MCTSWALSTQVNPNPEPNTLHPTPYTLHPTPYTLRPTPHTLHPTPATLHPTPYTLRPTPFTLRPTPYTLHPTPCTLHPQHSTLNTQHSSLNTRHSTLNAQHSTLNTQHLKLGTQRGTGYGPVPGNPCEGGVNRHTRAAFNFLTQKLRIPPQVLLICNPPLCSHEIAYRRAYGLSTCGLIKIYMRSPLCDPEL